MTTDIGEGASAEEAWPKWADEVRVMPCVACGKYFRMGVVAGELVQACGRGGVVICRTTGCYGSTVYDILAGDPLLAFIICDECFKMQRPSMFVVKFEEPSSQSDGSALASTSDPDASCLQHTTNIPPHVSRPFCSCGALMGEHTGGYTCPKCGRYVPAFDSGSITGG